MPCYDPRPDEDRKLLTRFACEVLARMELEGEEPPVYIRNWWKEHKEYDRMMKRTPIPLPRRKR